MLAESHTPRSLPSLRVLILYNEPVLPPDHPDYDSDSEVLFTVDEVKKVLVEHHEILTLGVCRDPEVLLEGLRRHRPDVVFNLFEGLADFNITESYVAGLLEWLRIPFTGSPHQAICMARNKHLMKYLLAGAGLPTAGFQVVDSLPVPECRLPWPVIVKPATQDASVGVDQGSVVTNQKQMEDRVAYLLEAYGPPVLVEQFIDGREFNVAVIEMPELRSLPISEIEFLDNGPGVWPIATYEAKWKPGTPDYERTPVHYPGNVDNDLADLVSRLSCETFRLAGLRDYGRVDFRVDPTGKPYILEVNPNSDISPLAGLSGSLQSAGIAYAGFILQLVQQAWARGATEGTKLFQG